MTWSMDSPDVHGIHKQASPSWLQINMLVCRPRIRINNIPKVTPHTNSYQLTIHNTHSTKTLLTPTLYNPKSDLLMTPFLPTSVPNEDHHDINIPLILHDINIPLILNTCTSYMTISYLGNGTPNP